MTTRFCVLPRLRTHEAICARLPYIVTSLCLVKNRSNFTVIFRFHCYKTCGVAVNLKAVLLQVKLSLWKQWGLVGEWRCNSTHNLCSRWGGCEWSASLPGRLTTGLNVPWTYQIESWKGPTVCTFWGNRKSLFPYGKWTPYSTVFELIA